MSDILGPANAVNAVTTRIAETRVFGTTDTWFKPCSTPAAQDGTQIQSLFLNGLLAQLRAAIRGNGLKNDGVTAIIAENNASDAMLLGAIQQLIQRGQCNFVPDTGTADVMVVAPAPALAEYEVGLRLLVLKNPLVAANATTTPTINAGLGPVTVVKPDGSALGIGDLKKGGLFEIELNGANPARLVSLLTISDVLALIAAAASVIRVTDTAGASTAQVLVGTASPAISAYSPSQIIVFTAAANNTAANPTINVTGAGGTALGPLTIVKRDLSALNQGDLLAGATYMGVPSLTGSKLLLLGMLPSDVRTRTRLTQNTTVNVNSTTGNDATADGTAAKPFASLTAAASYVQNNWDLNGYTVTFSAAGAFTHGLTINGLFLGQINGTSLVFDLGGTATITSPETCFYGGSGATFTVQNTGPLSSTGTGVGQGSALSAGGGASINYSNITAAACAVGHFSTSLSGSLNCKGNCFVTGSATYCLLSQNFGQIALNGFGITFSGSPTFTTVAYCYQGEILAAGSAFPVSSGTVTGQRYYATNWGNIYVGGSGGNVFPGSTAGATTSTGIYA